MNTQELPANDLTLLYIVIYGLISMLGIFLYFKHKKPTNIHITFGYFFIYYAIGAGLITLAIKKDSDSKKNQALATLESHSIQNLKIESHAETIQTGTSKSPGHRLEMISMFYFNIEGFSNTFFLQEIGSTSESLLAKLNILKELSQKENIPLQISFFTFQNNKCINKVFIDSQRFIQFPELHHSEFGYSCQLLTAIKLN